MALVASVLSIALPGFVPFATGPHGGSILSGTFPGSQRPGFVYLLHGMPGSPSEYLLGTNLPAFADDGISAGRLRPFIAVAPAAGPARKYNGEWAGPWEREIVDDVVPFVDTNLSTDASRDGRVLAGLSAGGFGAVYIALRNPTVFGAVESWSGYFHPLRDGPFKHASNALIAANDPHLLLTQESGLLARLGTRFFLSSGPYHSHWFRPAETRAFAQTLTRLGLPVRTLFYGQARGEWRAQLDAGLTWAFG